MVHQARHFTKLAACGVLTAALLPVCAIPAFSLVKMDVKTVDSAIVYGLKNQEMGLSGLLGPNWVEGEKGALLNVYTPYMMLASKASKLDLSDRPTATDLKTAKDKLGREVAYYRDPKNRLQVKFAVSFYGKAPDFAKTYSARIIGTGRGKDFTLAPAKQVLDQIADPVASESGLYEAVNSYYFKFSELENLQDFRLELTSPQGDPLVFHLNNEKLY